LEVRTNADALKGFIIKLLRYARVAIALVGIQIDLAVTQIFKLEPSMRVWNTFTACAGERALVIITGNIIEI
jgi:hypothetical protein